MICRYYAGPSISATRRNTELFPKNTASFGFFMPGISRNLLKTALRPKNAYAISGPPEDRDEPKTGNIDCWNRFELVLNWLLFYY